MKKVFHILMLMVVIIGLSSCEKDDPVIPNEGELITTLIYTLTPQNGGESVVLSFSDMGMGQPEVVTGTLKANTNYSGAIKLLNEIEIPVIDISEEVKEEGDEHQFFYLSTIEGLDVNYTDVDEDGLPIGLATQLVTKAAGSGELTIILRHEPAKDAPGVSDGDITNAGGETDIEVTFEVDVE